MFKKSIATLVAVLVGVGLSLVAVAAPASAHTAALSGTAVCQTDGTWTVTWTYNQTNTPSSGTGSQADVIVQEHTPMPSLVDGLAGTKYLNAKVGNENVNGQTSIPTRKGNWSQVFVQTGIAGTASSATVKVKTDWLGWGSATTTKTVNFTGKCEKPDTPVTVTAFPSATPPSCLVGGTLVVPTQTGVIFSGGTNGAGPGTYTIVASAAPGYKLTAPYSKQVTVLPADDALCEKVVIPVSTMSDLECKLNKPSGTYTLPETKWVDWYVNGGLTTTPTAVTASGDVKVEAKISAAGLAAGIVFTDGSTTVTVTHKFTLPAESCDPPVLALLTPLASQNNGSCTADPAFTLSNTTSKHGGVQWLIGDPQVETTPGSHKASWGSTVVVEATLVDPVLDGFEPGVQTEWTFKFPAKPACGDLVTLALTGGSAGGFVPWIAGAMLLLGAAGIYFRRRLVATSK